MQVGDIVEGVAVMTMGETSPPKLFTDGDLIDVMKNVTRYFPVDAETRITLLSGIGTARTREPTIRGLFDRHLVTLLADGKKKPRYVIPTEKGLMVFRLASENSPELCSPVLTAKYEEMLSKVASGEMSIDDFVTRNQKITEVYIANIKAKASGGSSAGGVSAITPIKGDGEVCQKCQKGTMKTRYSTKHEKYFLSCNNTLKQGTKWVGCDNVIFPESEGWVKPKEIHA